MNVDNLLFFFYFFHFLFLTSFLVSLYLSLLSLSFHKFSSIHLLKNSYSMFIHPAIYKKGEKNKKQSRQQHHDDEWVAREGMNERQNLIEWMNKKIMKIFTTKCDANNTRNSNSYNNNQKKTLINKIILHPFSIHSLCTDNQPCWLVGAMNSFPLTWL